MFYLKYIQPGCNLHQYLNQISLSDLISQTFILGKHPSEQEVLTCQ